MIDDIIRLLFVTHFQWFLTVNSLVIGIQHSVIYTSLVLHTFRIIDLVRLLFISQYLGWSANIIMARAFTASIK